MLIFRSVFKGSGMLRRVFVVLCLVVGAGNLSAWGQVRALFAVDTTRIKSLSVLFTALDTVPGYRYGWDLGDGTLAAGTRVEHLYSAPGTYRVVLEVQDPLSGDRDTAVRVVRVRDVLQVPNVFTPNNDNINDLFIVRSNGQETYHLTIFTRAGIRVCDVHGTTVVWDGRTPSGVLVAPGVYYYVLRDNHGQSRTGFVHVIY